MSPLRPLGQLQVVSALLLTSASLLAGCKDEPRVKDNLGAKVSTFWRGLKTGKSHNAKAGVTLEVFTSTGIVEATELHAAIAELSKAPPKGLYPFVYHLSQKDSKRHHDPLVISAGEKRYGEYQKALKTMPKLPAVVVNGQAACYAADLPCLKKALARDDLSNTGIEFSRQALRYDGPNSKSRGGFTLRAESTVLAKFRVDALVASDIAAVFGKGANRKRRFSMRGTVSFVKQLRELDTSRFKRRSYSYAMNVAGESAHGQLRHFVVVRKQKSPTIVAVTQLK